jgi:hypothetical protein
MKKHYDDEGEERPARNDGEEEDNEEAEKST